MMTSLPIHYFNKVPNIGDVLNTYIVPKISGTSVRIADRLKEHHLVAIGSLMGAATKLSHVWGSGVISPDRNVRTIPVDQVYALRGKLSVSDIKRRGMGIADVPLGDPAVLISEMIDRSEAQNYKIGVVAHYKDRESAWFKSIEFGDEICDVDVALSPEYFVRRLTECECIISSSLHGLIIADAYKIPNQWLEVSDKVVGKGFKFRDWYSTTSTPDQRPVNASVEMSEMARMCDIRELFIDKAALLDAFPIANIMSANGN